MEIAIEAWGDLACFTRPEAKVERFSYPVPTPSAARGILDAIYVKPIEFYWQINRIEVLHPIKYIALKRNEVKEVISSAALKKAEKGAGEPPVIIADGTRDLTGSDAKGRTQRQTMALKNVHYRIFASIKPRKGFDNKLTALYDQAMRRIENGKCFYQPYFGCREFVAYFAPAGVSALTAVESIDIGYMLYDVFDLGKVFIDNAKPFISVFRAQLDKGIMIVPEWTSNFVLKPEV